MIRVSEMVLPGHPDKFCDQVADAIVAASVATDPAAYSQIEVSVWSDHVWLSGGICTAIPIKRRLQDIVVETGKSIGYIKGNCIDASRYVVTSTVCERVGDPTVWSSKVNDQSVVIGWAGYDAGTHYLPPEHYLAHLFREALTRSCHNGALAGQGPDGKLMVWVREQSNGWELEQVLVTVQQQESIQFVELCDAIVRTLEHAYLDLIERDPRWRTPWCDVELLVNPNGPLVNGGSNGDNGQTGRKLVMDFYGPRIAIGGGALSGKHLSHIDRIGAYEAREAAVHAVQTGAQECLVRLTYAPNTPDPLDISYEMIGRGTRRSTQDLEHGSLLEKYPASSIGTGLARGTHFFDPALPWNGRTSTGDTE